MKRNEVRKPFKDPVCGVMVTPSTSTAKWEFGEKIYYFCADVCRDAFKADPHRFLHKRARWRGSSRCREHQHRHLGFTSH